jgi:hypothetical protein
MALEKSHRRAGREHGGGAERVEMRTGRLLNAQGEIEGEAPRELLLFPFAFISLSLLSVTILVKAAVDRHALFCSVASVFRALRLQVCRINCFRTGLGKPFELEFSGEKARRAAGIRFAN